MLQNVMHSWSATPIYALTLKVAMWNTYLLKRTVYVIYLCIVISKLFIDRDYSSFTVFDICMEMTYLICHVKYTDINDSFNVLSDIA